MSGSSDLEEFRTFDNQVQKWSLGHSMEILKPSTYLKNLSENT